MQEEQTTTQEELDIEKDENITLPTGWDTKKLLAKISAEKKAAVEYQRRRHQQWIENYALYRDTVQINRLTQRQAINVPLIKETGKTILSRIDEEPGVFLEDRGGNEDKEIVMNEKWGDDYDRNKLELHDIIEKKQVYLYGRTHTKHNWVNGQWVSEIKDIFDLVVDPKTAPLDIQTARYMTELHIYRPVAEIVTDKRYAAATRTLLKLESVSGDMETVAESNSRTIESAKDIEMRKERMLAIGATLDEIQWDGYDQLAELNQHFTYLWDTEKEVFIKYVIVFANDKYILRAKPLKEELGIDEYPVDTWADDLEATDYWSDSIADILRVLNQILNIWISQLVENRTLRNFGMNFYDSTASEGWTPVGYDPQPGGWYPLPGKPSEVYQRVDIPDLGSIMADMQFIVGMAERASATGAIDKGIVEQGKRTLGEIEIAVSKSMERTNSMSKFYRRAWRDRVGLWIRIMNENQQSEFTLYKKSASGRIKPGTFKRDQWHSEEGWKVRIESYNQNLAEKAEEIQRLQAVKQMFGDNPALDKAMQRRALGIVELLPEEKKDIMDYEEQKREQVAGIGSDMRGLPPELVKELGGGLPPPQIPAVPTQ